MKTKIAALFLVYFSCHQVAYAQEKSTTTPVVLGTQGIIEFKQSIANADTRIRELFDEVLDTKGQINRNLSPNSVGKLQAILREELAVNLDGAQSKLLADQFVQEARFAGKDWRAKFSVTKLYKPNGTWHGYVAEGIDCDDLLRRFSNNPQVQIGFTNPNSKSADLFVRFGKNGPPARLIQTKTYNTAIKSLNGGLFDAQACYANKAFKLVFEVHIPLDQFDELVKNGIVDAKTFKIIHPEQFTSGLRQEAVRAFEKTAATANSNAHRLQQITKVHGNLEEFNLRVLERSEVRPLSRTYNDIVDLRDQSLAVRRSILHESALETYKRSMPTKGRIAINAAAVTAIMSVLGTFYEKGFSVKSAEEAVRTAAIESTKVAAVTYVAEGIMRKIGERIIFTTFIDTATMTTTQIAALGKTLPGIQNKLYAGHVTGTAFLATFIFDEAGTIVKYSNGDISGQEFLFESGENLARSSVVAAVSWGTIMLGAGPGGLVVVAAAIGTHVLIGSITNSIEKYNSRKHIQLDDFIGRLPASIQNRMIELDGFQTTTMERTSHSRKNLISNRASLIPNRKTVFDIE